MDDTYRHHEDRIVRRRPWIAPGVILSEAESETEKPYFPSADTVGGIVYTNGNTAGPS